MLVFSFVIFSLIIFALQTTLFPLLPTWLGRPDLIFLLVVFLAYRFDSVKGAAVVFFIGLLLDVFSGIFLGIYPTIYLLIFFVLKMLSKHIANETTYQAPLAVVSYLFYACCVFVSTSLLAPEIELDWSWRTMLLQILMLAIIAMPFFLLCELYMNFCTTTLRGWRPFRLKDSSNRFKS
jgi:rod shape-determining protein MreD